MDTRMISTGRWGATGEIAKELGDNPSEYAEYLNDLWVEKELGKFSPSFEDFESVANTANTKSQIQQLGLSKEDSYLMQKACNDIY